MPGSESTSVTIFRTDADRQKLLKACEAFGWVPWIAVYVETDRSADLYLTSLENYDCKYRGKGIGRQDTWKMSKLLTGQYREDPESHHLSVTFEASKWWPVQAVALPVGGLGHEVDPSEE